MAQQVVSIARRLEVYLPDGASIESLTLVVQPEHAGQAVVHVTWDGGRWTLQPKRLAVHDIRMLAEHLRGQVCQTNDLDVWRASLLPTEMTSPGWRDLGDALVQLGEQA
ncbi:hypothetical protein D3875_00720 [Deinococcus cavernae]|uniref:Uncharacterized protein n=2 Tax=Deinococcus cavernae TaxID=2320857 RepID=A0A418VHT8_9DEIO|nr:hypothetical protein D3875_00720 [Deinococcus cavernae]